MKKTFVFFFIIISTALAYTNYVYASGSTDSTTSSGQEIPPDARLYLYSSSNLTEVRRAIQDGADINVRNRNSNNDTALMQASKNGHLDIVRYLVEQGAKINLRDDVGNTAASLAYDKGEIEIYDYLKANGAIDYEPRQVAQPAAPAPSSTTNVYVQPSAPAQSTPSEPSHNTGNAIANAFKSPLQSGTYSLAGTQAKIRLTAIAKSGVFSYTNRQGGTGTGSYSIDGNRMTIQMESYTLVYTVTSETSFSGSGETWVRTGY